MWSQSAAQQQTGQVYLRIFCRVSVFMYKLPLLALYQPVGQKYNVAKTLLVATLVWTLPLTL